MKFPLETLLLLAGCNSATAGNGIRAGNDVDANADGPHARRLSHGVFGSSESEQEGQTSYEIWGSDQSNSVSSQTSPGAAGGYIWIWDSKDVETQLSGGEDAQPLPCDPSKDKGPCDLNFIFPSTLKRVAQDGTEIDTLGDLVPGFGRLHGMLVDPTGRYLAASAFFPTGGYVGVIDSKTREAIGLFRVTQTEATGSQRSVHMCFWSEDGKFILVTNLHGKMIERIDVVRKSGEGMGEIVNLKYNLSAGIYLGKNWSKVADATVFTGANSLGNPLMGEIVGSYAEADTGDLTPSGACKETGCTSSTVPMLGGVRSNNVPICPIPSPEGYVYVTMGGGGLLVLKSDTTPLAVAGEYGNAVVNGAGCGGAMANGHMFLNAGVSASEAGLTQSTFGLYAFPDAKFNENFPNGNAVQNHPYPIQLFKDQTNTNTIGNVDGTDSPNLTGQLPNNTTRRDSHGAWSTLDGKFVHVADRIRNVMEVFDAEAFERVNTYDLVSATGKGGQEGRAGPCLSKSVPDDGLLPRNDPAPDLVTGTPEGKYFAVAFRGPKPVSVNHAAQGSCPGIGMVEVTKNGKAGKLVGVLRATNTVDTVPVGTIPGGHDYTGAERSDVHHAAIVLKY